MAPFDSKTCYQLNKKKLQCEPPALVVDKTPDEGGKERFLRLKVCGFSLHSGDSIVAGVQGGSHIASFSWASEIKSSSLFPAPSL